MSTFNLSVGLRDAYHTTIVATFAALLSKSPQSVYVSPGVMKDLLREFCNCFGFYIQERSSIDTDLDAMIGITESLLAELKRVRGAGMAK